MRTSHPVRLACAVLAGLALAASGLAGPASAAATGTSPAAKPGGIISTIAGGPGGPGPATSYTLSPCDVHYAHGYVYIGEDNFVRRVSAATGVLATVAGNDAGGPDTSGGPATGTGIGASSDTEYTGGACGTAVDAAGNLVIADGAVWVVAARTGTFYGQQMTAGHIYGVMSGVGAAVGVAVDAAGNLVVANNGSGFYTYGNDFYYGATVDVLAARTGTFYGQQMTAGNTYNIAGISAEQPSSLPIGDGGPATQAWLGTVLGTVQMDGAGNIVLAAGGPGCGSCGQANYLQYSVQVIAGATGTFYGQKMTAGDIYDVAGVPGYNGFPSGGGPATQADLENPGGVAIDHAGNLVIADDALVRVVAVRTGTFYGQKMTAGDIYRVAGVPGPRALPGFAGFSGDGGPATRAKVTADTVSIDGDGNVVLDNGGNRVRVIAERSGTFYGRRMTAGDIYTVAGNGSSQWLSGWGQRATSAQIGSPNAISADPAGDVAVTSNGTVLTIPARTGTFFGRHLTAGNLYIVTRAGCTADNCVALDGSGDVVIGGSPVRLIPVRSGRFFGQSMIAGHSYAVSAKASAVGTDHHGNALLVDGFRVAVTAATSGTFYGRTMTAGHTYVVAGDGLRAFNGNGRLATYAGMWPQGVAVDAAGNLIVTDHDYRVRVVAVRTGTFYGQQMTAGRVYTIAGHGTAGFSGSGGPAADAEFGSPDGVTVARSGIVLFADPADAVVWAVAVRTGTFYRQQMTAGHAYVVAGGGTQVPGDASPATGAALAGPTSVAAGPTGALLLTDNGDNRLRSVSP
ncbi:MAG TPA: hypothetical protein VNV62_14800 [Trebonia sp.]|jgi:hypothetical protein|nr:hypothetical protein [Trebonia sp.]